MNDSNCCRFMNLEDITKNHSEASTYKAQPWFQTDRQTDREGEEDLTCQVSVELQSHEKKNKLTKERKNLAYNPVVTGYDIVF